MSYTIEVYRKKQKAERHFGIYALYVMYYPQLVAGPIERPQNLLHQFKETHFFEYTRVVSGLRKMLWGFFMKIVIADNLGVYVDYVYDKPMVFSGLPLIIATIFFSFQIYCDFAGYSLIAIGISQIMGIKLMTNFNSPYFDKSIPEFWRRWHISLSTWFKDYLYIPLGGNRTSKPRLYFNLMLVFIISGIWHGANWTFIIWGFLHGFYQIISLLTANIQSKIKKLITGKRLILVHNFLRIILTFTLVSIAWIFFRASTVENAFYIIKNSFNFGAPTKIPLTAPLGVIRFSLLICSVIFLIITEYFINNKYYVNIFNNNSFLRFIIYYILFYSIILSLIFFNVPEKPFIYFQF